MSRGRDRFSLGRDHAEPMSSKGQVHYVIGIADDETLQSQESM